MLAKCADCFYPGTHIQLQAKETLGPGPDSTGPRLPHQPIRAAAFLWGAHSSCLGPPPFSLASRYRLVGLFSS